MVSAMVQTWDKYDSDPILEPYAMLLLRMNSGSGDVYRAFYQSGLLDRFLAEVWMLASVVLGWSMSAFLLLLQV